MKKLVILCMAASMSSSLAFAQSKVTGVVKDGTGEPIIGASVSVKGAQGVGAVTDLDGNFTLTVPSGKKQLLVSYIGFTPQTIDVTGKNTFEIVLKEDNQTLNEVVVVGYGTMKKSDLAGATGSMDEKKMKGSIITNLDQSLGGRVAGVTSMATSGVQVLLHLSVCVVKPPSMQVPNLCMLWTVLSGTTPTHLVLR